MSSEETGAEVPSPVPDAETGELAAVKTATPVKRKARAPKAPTAETKAPTAEKKPVRKRAREKAGDLFGPASSESEPSVEAGRAQSEQTDGALWSAASLADRGAQDPVLEDARTAESVSHMERVEDPIQELKVQVALAPNVWRLLTNRSNLLTMLGSGCITTQAEAWRYATDSRVIFGGALPIWRGAMPQQLLPLATEKGILAPVVLEFSSEIENWLPPAETNLRLTRRTLPFSLVQRVIFRDQATLEDFRLKQFDDLPEVPESILRVGFADFEIADHAAQVETDPAPESSLAFNVFDKTLGAMLFAMDVLPGRASARPLCGSLLGMMIERVTDSKNPPGGSGMHFRSSSYKAGITERTEDSWLLEKTLEYLTPVDPESGFDGLRFLDWIWDATQKSPPERSSSLSSHGVAAVCEWVSHCRQILEGTKEVWPLTDTVNTSFVQRGVLLFILRPEQGRLQKAGESSLRPGPKVFLLAAFILGYFIGVTRLESSAKKDVAWFFRFTEHLLKVASAGEERRFPALAIKVVQSADDRGTLEIRHGDVLLRGFDLAIPESLRRVLRLSREANMTATIDIDGGVGQIKTGRLPTVSFRELLGRRGESRIRLYADCVSLARAGILDPSEGRRSVLEVQGSEEVIGKFVVQATSLQVVYAVDVAAATLTGGELQILVTHIAEISQREWPMAAGS